MLTGSDVLQARLLLNWSVRQLMKASGLSFRLIDDVERHSGGSIVTSKQEKALLAAFEAAGLEFIVKGRRVAQIRFRSRADGTREEH